MKDGKTHERKNLCICSILLIHSCCSDSLKSIISSHLWLHLLKTTRNVSYRGNVVKMTLLEEFVFHDMCGKKTFSRR